LATRKPACQPQEKVAHGLDIELEVAIFGDCDDAFYRPVPPSQHICSWVNGARTVDQGSHVTGMLNTLEAVNWDPELMLIHVIMHDPAYAGPSRSQLDVPHVAQAVQAALQELLREHRQNNGLGG
jgi:DNA gyrase subunit B